jgi:hypothetical protein
MRTFLVLICSLALACAAGGAQEKNKSKNTAPKKKQAQSTQHAAPRARPAGGGPHKINGPQSGAQSGHAVKSYTNRPGVTTAGAGTVKTKGKTKGSQQITGQQGAYYGVQKTKKSKMTSTSNEGFQSRAKTKGSQQVVTQRGPVAKGHFLGLDHNLVNKSNYVTKYKTRHFSLQTKIRPTTITGVTFQQNRRIVGSQNWQGQNYWAFRTYTPVWRDRNWWNSHYNRVVFVFGGWYAWNDNYWVPAWGYAPNAYYAYDGPIYAYNGLPPDQVVANVQAALQEQGYYHGEVDGLLGPLTRAALADYQRDHGLYETAAIDRRTLESLGMA